VSLFKVDRELFNQLAHMHVDLFRVIRSKFDSSLRNNVNITIDSIIFASKLTIIYIPRSIPLMLLCTTMYIRSRVHSTVFDHGDHAALEKTYVG
jgi:hypothetical protein